MWAPGYARAAAALVPLLALPLVGCGEQRPRAERIVLVVVDTLRADVLSLYGGSLTTPNLEILAAHGRVFRGLHASFHQTSMSMGALFSGRTPSIESHAPERPLFWSGQTWCGLARFAERRTQASCVPERLETLAEALRETGYWTIGIASNEFLYEPSGFSAGFDDWVEVGRLPGLETRTATVRKGRELHEYKLIPWQAVVGAMVEALARRPRDRFFLYLHFMDVHDYDQGGTPYARGVARMDRALGRVLSILADEGLAEGTTVVFTSDHGERLDDVHPIRGGRGHLGNPSFQEVLRIPLVITPAPERPADAFVRTQDLKGWILDLAGVAAPGGDSDEVLEDDELYLGEHHYFTYQRGRFKSSVRRDERRTVLFDLAADPAETRDVSADHPEVLREHADRVSQIAERLATRPVARRSLTARERERLQILGYLE